MDIIKYTDMSQEDREDIDQMIDDIGKKMIRLKRAIDEDRIVSVSAILVSISSNSKLARNMVGEFLEQEIG